jgi:hypothetical protein
MMVFTPKDKHSAEEKKQFNQFTRLNAHKHALYPNPIAQRIKRQIEFRNELLRSFEQYMAQERNDILDSEFTRHQTEIALKPGWLMTFQRRKIGQQGRSTMHC